MGLVLESQEKTLTMTGEPIGIYPKIGDEPAGLMVNFLTVSGADRKVVASGFEASIPLTQEWHKTISDMKVGPNDHLVFDLERVDPETADEKMLAEVLYGNDSSLYAIKDVRSAPSPLAPYR